MGRFTYSGERMLQGKLRPNKLKIEATKRKLKDFWKSMNLGPMEMEKKVSTAIDKAIFGWPNAPMNFDSRIKQIMGPNSLKLKRKRDKTYKQMMSKTVKGAGLDFIDEQIDLNEQEVVYMKKRIKEYEGDFEFNKSSDRVLLYEIVVDEILLRRIKSDRLVDITVNRDIEKTNHEIQERYRKNLSALGVSRAQRVEFDQNIEGNVGQLSTLTESKLDNIKNLQDNKKRTEILNNICKEFTDITKDELVELAKEIAYQRKHEMMGEKNPVSEAELNAINTAI